MSRKAAKCQDPPPTAWFVQEQQPGRSCVASPGREDPRQPSGFPIALVTEELQILFCVLPRGVQGGQETRGPTLLSGREE